MTTFERTWTPDVNRVPENQTTIAFQGKWLTWYYKAFIKGEIGGASAGLWTCAGSSDGSTAGMDSSDRWGSSFDSTKIVRAAVGAHSWIVLESPAALGPFYICIDYSTSNDAFLNIYASKNAFTGGSTTARPTSTTEWTATASNQSIINSTLNACHVHGFLASDGCFSILSSQDGSGRFCTAFSFFSLMNTKSAEAHNGWTYFSYNSSAPGPFGASSNTESFTGYSAAVGSGGIQGRNATNSANVAGGSIIPAAYNSSTMLSAFSSIHMGSVDATDSKYDDFPCFLFVTTTGYKSIRGRVPDIFFAPESAASGLSEPTSGPPYDSTIVGNVWHPWKSTGLPSL